MRLLIKFISSSFSFFFWITGWISISQAQPFPACYFSSPLTIPLTLAGNFGEIRMNHFHSGLDFKTDSVIGKEVLAAADGYVSRIRVSASGFGKALYLTHPNGYVSVYGHLHRFNDALQEFVLKEQYAKEQFETELFPDSNQFRVNKGDRIAWSGNSGGSEGPHLHFEIRDAKTEKPINPLFFGYEIADTIGPVIEKIIFKPFGSPEQHLQRHEVEVPLSLDPNHADTIYLSGYYGLEFSGYDLANSEKNHLGIYRIDVTIDQAKAYHLELDSFSFDETRYVNAHIDYSKKIDEQEVMERCYRLPGDFFSLNLENNDSILPEFVPEKTIHLTLSLFDYNGNKTERKLILHGTSDAIEHTSQQVSNLPVRKKNLQSAKLLYKQLNRFGDATMHIEIPVKALYEDGLIRYISEKKPIPFYPGQQQHILSGSIPFHVPYSLTLREPHFPVLLRNKACIVMQGKKNKLIFIGGVFKGDSITVKTRSLGTMLVYADTVPPVIREYQLVHDSIFNKELLVIPIDDELSGIASFRGTLDGKWILMEYDEKTASLIYTFETPSFIQDKTLRLEVLDRKENVVVYETVLKK